MTARIPAQATTVPAPGFRLTARLQGEQLTIALLDDVDCGSAATLSTQIQAILAAGLTRQVTIDLARLEFCDSAGVRAFTRLHQTAAEHGVTVSLRHPRPHIRWLLQTLDVMYLLDATPP